MSLYDSWTLVHELIILFHRVQSVISPKVGIVLVNGVYKGLAQGFVGKSREQGHPTIETRSHLLITHTLVITLDNLNERPNNLSEECNANEHENASNNLLISGDWIVVSVTNSGKRGQGVVAHNDHLGLKSYPAVLL